MNVGERRLRKLREQSLVRFYNQGWEAGLRWADESADCKQLDRLHALEREYRFDWETLFHDGSAWTCGEGIAFCIEPAINGCRPEAARFWESVYDEDGQDLASEPEFVRGFVEAAIWRWDQVKREP